MTITTRKSPAEGQLLTRAANIYTQGANEVYRLHIEGKPLQQERNARGVAVAAATLKFTPVE
jgi:hypothetical protein